jgi:hypothetical protein
MQLEVSVLYLQDLQTIKHPKLKELSALNLFL